MAIYESTPPIVTNGLVLALDAANKKSYVSGSTIWNDLSGFNNNGTLVNGPTFSSENNGNIVMDGNDDIIYFYNKVLPVAAFTTSFTFKLTNILTTGFTYLQNNGGYQNYGYYTEIFNASDAFAITLSKTGAITGANFSFNRADVINKVVNVVWTYDGTTIKGYQNGILKTTVTATIVPDIPPVISPWFGNLMIGGVYTILNYNRALSAQEVLQNYNALKNRFNLR
jgi:hypothetical protein